jgi:hypothetical protein
LYSSFWVDDFSEKVTRITGVVELKKPNTRIKIMGKRKLKMTAEGLRKIDFRLAFAIASIATT